MNEPKDMIVFNNAGKGNYTNESDIENVIRYVVRQNKTPKEDLVGWGGLGVTEFYGVETVVRQFKSVQKMHTRSGNFGRYIDHETFSLSPEDEQTLCKANADVDALARKMAYDFYDRDHCQVIYAIHRPKNPEKHLHFHFAINTVNFVNGNKRRENISQTQARSRRFTDMVREAIGELQ